MAEHDLDEHPHRHKNMNRVCARCWWYFKISNEEGYCTNTPPDVVSIEGRIVSVRPTVQGGEWCARWHERGQDPGAMAFPSKKGRR